MKVALIAVLGLITISCCNLVYSPSINLPTKIQQNETKVVAAYEILPSTRWDTDKGAILAVQHSFSDNFCIELKYWTDFDTYASGIDYLHGASLISHILLNSADSPWKFYLAPTIGTSLISNSFKMGTIGSWVAIRTPDIYVFEPYAALGFIYGNEDFKSDNQYGYGIMVNLGTNIPIYKNLRFNFELSVPTVINMYWRTGTTYFTPTIGFNYGF